MQGIAIVGAAGMLQWTGLAGQLLSRFSNSVQLWELQGYSSGSGLPLTYRVTSVTQFNCGICGMLQCTGLDAELQVSSHFSDSVYLWDL